MSHARPKEVTQELERQAWNLRMDCWTQEHIAEHLGLTQEVVSRMLKRTAEKLQKAFEAEIALMRVEQTGQLMRIAEAALKVFHTCQQPEPPQETASLPPESSSCPVGGGQSSRMDLVSLNAPNLSPFSLEGNSRRKSEFGLREARHVPGGG